MNIIELNKEELTQIKGLSLFLPKKNESYYDRLRYIFWDFEEKRLIATNGMTMAILKDVEIKGIADRECWYCLDGNYLKEVDGNFKKVDYNRIINSNYEHSKEIDYDVMSVHKPTSYYKDVKLFSFIEYFTELNFNPELLKDISKYFAFSNLHWNNGNTHIKLYSHNFDLIVMPRGKKRG